MSPNDAQAAEAYPPGEFVKEEIEFRGWSQTDLAEIFGKSVDSIRRYSANADTSVPSTTPSRRRSQTLLLHRSPIVNTGFVVSSSHAKRAPNDTESRWGFHSPLRGEVVSPTGFEPVSPA